MKLDLLYEFQPKVGPVGTSPTRTGSATRSSGPMTRRSPRSRMRTSWDSTRSGSWSTTSATVAPRARHRGDARWAGPEDYEHIGSASGSR